MRIDLDLIIIGAGPIGLACGIEAEKCGYNYVIIEKGCLVNSIYNYPTNMTFFSTSERLEIGDVPFISHGVKPTRTEALEYYRRVKTSWNLKVNTYEKVKAVSGSDGNFSVLTTKSDYSCKKLIIAIGFFDYPNMMNIPGESLSKVKHYYDEPHPYAGQKLIIVGGGNSAVDVALETFRRGSDVTMVIKKDKLEEGVKYWVRPDIENRIQEGAIKAFFNSELKEIREKDVIIITPDGEVTTENDFVLAMTGYHPDINFMQSAGINFTGEGTEPFYKEDNFETNIPGLFLAGVVCCGYNTHKWFIENSREHAVKIFEHLGNSM